MLLYKYVPGNKYDIKNIKVSTLWLNTPIGFNDPFDMSAAFEIKDQAGVMELYKNENAGEDLTGIDKFSENDLLKIARLNDKKELWNARYGITCFSRTDKNILMWSHYADSHKGLCLGYRFEDGIHIKEKFLDENSSLKGANSFIAKLWPIDYVEKYNRPVFSYPADDDKQVDNLLKYKYKAWSYEKEERLFVMTRDESYRPFPCLMHYQANCLSEIIFGAMMPLARFVEICKKIKNNIEKQNIAVYGTILNTRIYELTKHPITTDAFQIICDNYSALRRPSWIFYHPEMKKLSETHAKNAIYRFWQNALDHIPLMLILSELNCLLEIDVADHLKRMLKEKRETMMSELFMDWMVDAVQNSARK